MRVSVPLGLRTMVALNKAKPAPAPCIDTNMHAGLRFLKLILSVGFSAGLVLTGMAAFSSGAAEAQLAVKPQAREFPASAVRLLEGPFQQAMEVDKAFLLRVDSDRLLAGFRREAGLPKKAEPYRGWENIPPRGRWTVAGHSLGH